MFIGYQDVELRVYDDQSQDFYDYLEDSELEEEDEFIGRFVKRKFRNKKAFVKNSLFGFGGMGMGAKIGLNATKKLRRSIKRRKARRSSRPKVIVRKPKHTQRVAAGRGKIDTRKVSTRKTPKYTRPSTRPSYPSLKIPIKRRVPIKKRLPKNWGSPIKAPVVNIPTIRKKSAPVRSSSSRKSATPSTSLGNNPKNFKATSNDVSTQSREAVERQMINDQIMAGSLTEMRGPKVLENLEERLGTEKPKQAGMSKSIIWIVAIVGGLIIVTKVFGDKKTSEIVKIKKAT